MFMLHINVTKRQIILLGNWWKSPHNRRNFLIEFASQHNFDPLVPENWKNIHDKDICDKQVFEK